MQANYEVDAEILSAPLRRVVRPATPEDEQLRRRQRELADQAVALFKQLVRERRLRVKTFSGETLFDGGRVLISYGTDDKVDARPVAAEVTRRIGVRVEARAVGPRDGARAVGSVGLCGPQLCSTRFPSHEQPVTLRMAKDQDVPMNPGRITGLCGRLRCCLAFEHPVYRAFRDRAPAVGRTVVTPDGRGVVRSYKVPADAVVVLLEVVEVDGVYSLDDVREQRRG